MPLEPRELIELASEELRQCNSPYLSLDISAIDGMAFLGMMQLVLRHPDLPDSMSEVARRIADAIECQLSACGPATREIMRAGWETDPSGDD